MLIFFEIKIIQISGLSQILIKGINQTLIISKHINSARNKFDIVNKSFTKMGRISHREDGRRVKNVNQKHPFNGIVKIRAQIMWENKLLLVQGNGAIINPRVILTSASNVCAMHDKMPEKVFVQFEGQKSEICTVKVEWIGINHLYLENQKNRFLQNQSAAILILEQNSLINPNMIIKMNNKNNFQIETLFISAYLRLQDAKNFLQEDLISDQNKLIMVALELNHPAITQNNVITYKHQTTPGFGGAPLIIKTQNNLGNNEYEMIGIHIGKKPFCGFGQLTTQKQLNSMIRLAHQFNVAGFLTNKKILQKIKQLKDIEFFPFNQTKDESIEKEKMGMSTGDKKGEIKQTKKPLKQQAYKLESISKEETFKSEKLSSYLPTRKDDKQKQQTLGLQKVEQKININSRLYGHFAFRTNQVILHNIKVNEQVLYYEPYDNETTIQDLSNQYASFTGKQLKLTASNISLAKNTKITQIVYQLKDESIFEQLVNQIQKQDYIIIKKLTGRHIEWFKKKYQDELNRKRQLIQQVKKGWNCQILIKHYKDKPQAIAQKAYLNTTINGMIKLIEKKMKLDLWNVEVLDQKQKPIKKQNYSREFYELDMIDCSLIFFIPPPNCFFRDNTFTLLKNEKYILKSIKDIPESQNQKFHIDNIMSYNVQKKRLEPSELSNHKKVLGIFSYVKIQVEKKEYSKQSIFTLIKLECSRDVMFITEEKGWMVCSMLKEGQRILCCTNQKYDLGFLPIVRIQYIEIDRNIAESQRPKFYSLSSEPHHNIVMNGIICHNKNTVNIQVYQYEQNSKSQTSNYQISIYRYEVIAQRFKDKVCLIGGMQVNNKYTFGDYQIDRFKTIFVSDRQQKWKVPLKYLLISELDGINYIYTPQKEEINSFASTFSKKEPAAIQLDNKLTQWKNDYLGIYQQRIISVNESELNSIHQKAKYPNLLIDKRGNLQLLNYLLNIEPVFLKQEHQNKIFKIKQKNSGNSDMIKAIKLYTGGQTCDQAIFTPSGKQNYYSRINMFLRNEYSKINISEESFLSKINDEKSLEYISLTTWMNTQIRSLPDYSGTVYRGIPNIQLDVILKNALNQTIVFLEFTSTSEDKNIALSFANKQNTPSDKNIFITIIVRNGKDIRKWSKIPSQKQVLILPFTYFYIVDKNTNNSISSQFGKKFTYQTLTLEQIPLPKTSSKCIIFWVDDEPENNSAMAGQFRKSGIEVIQITSTKIMQIILKKFFWSYKLIGKQILIISDMTRKQDDTLNHQAGIDLFTKIYGDYGLSNKGIIYCGDVSKAKQSLAKQLNISLEQVQKNDKWLISHNPIIIKKEVFNYFQQFLPPKKH